MSGSLSLSEARELISRAVDKAEQVRSAGAIVVADQGGHVISASRMDAAGPLGMRTGRSKTYMAAATRRPTNDFLKEMAAVPPILSKSYMDVLPRQAFLGAGAMPLKRGDAVIGALGASGATMGPFVKYPGSDPRLLVVDGKPANAEDLVISYARGLSAYDPQHGDDNVRWEAAYGGLPGPEFAACDGLAEAPRYSSQPILRAALALADKAMAAGRAEDLRIAVAIVDVHGDAIQLDRDDGCWTAALDMAEMVATCAALFSRESDAVASDFGLETLAAFRAHSGRDISSAPGGVPLYEDGRLSGAIGIAGASPARCKAIAVQIGGGFNGFS